MTERVLIDDDLVRLLGAVIDVHAREGRATIRRVAEVAGLTVNTTWHWINRLEELGLVARGSKGAQGSLHPTMRVMARAEVPW